MKKEILSDKSTTEMIRLIKKFEEWAEGELKDTDYSNAKKDKD